MSKTPILVTGALGRMGQGIVNTALSRDNFKVVGACARPGFTTAVPSHWPHKVHEDLFMALDKAAQKPCVILDFSTKECLAANLAAAQEYRLPIMIGTTGHNDDARAQIEKAAQNCPVLYAPNTSLMANLLMGLCAISAQALGKKTQSHIVDLHHQHKKDAPSGTALALKKAITSQINAPQVEVFSQRAGNVAGEHTVYFFGEHERLELCHRVSDRQVLVEGALIAAEFIFKQAPGLYGMNDVLNLKLGV